MGELRSTVVIYCFSLHSFSCNYGYEVAIGVRNTANVTTLTKNVAYIVYVAFCPCP